MAHLSQRRDLSDDDMVARFVKRVGDEETLKQLFVLTFCDTAMTAPGNLNEWKGQLLRELYLKARDHFHGDAAAGDGEAIERLGGVDGLLPVLDRYLPDLPAESRVFGGELLLEGLHQHSVLAREALPDGVSFTDMVSRMFEDFGGERPRRST